MPLPVWALTSQPANTVATGVTITVYTSELLPQVLLTVYEISTLPPDSPVTTPPDVMLAIAELLLLHVPPTVAFVNVMELVIVTAAGPDIAATGATVLTVIALVTIVVPQLFVTLYVIFTAPAATPLTTPVDAFTVAIDVDELVHVPPAVEFVRVVVAPVHTVDDPPIAANDGAPLFTVIVIVLVLLQLLALVPVTVYVVVVVPVKVTVAPVDALKPVAGDQE